MQSFESLDKNEMCVCTKCKDEMSIWSFWKDGKVLKSCQLCRDLEASRKKIQLEKIIEKRKSWGHYKE